MKFQDGLQRGRCAIVLALGTLTVGCSDHPLDSRTPAGGPSHVYQLPAIEATACRYGGEYPFCRSPSPSDPDVGINPGTEPPPPEGGGDSGSTDLPPLCDSRDTACLRPLTGSDSTLIQAALGRVKRASEFKDPRVAEACTALDAQLSTLFSQGRVFRGADGIPDNLDNEEASHQAQAWLMSDGTYIIHIDGDALDRAAAAGTDSGWDAVIADWLLHEAAHTLGYRHTGQTVAPYTTEPFNHMSGGPAEQCVR